MLCEGDEWLQVLSDSGAGLQTPALLDTGER